MYINENKLSKEVKENLQGVKIAPYEEIFEHIKTLGESVDEEKTTGKVFVSNKCSWALTLSLGETKVIEGLSLSKARL